MQLQYLVLSNAFAFTEDSSIITLEGEDFAFENKEDAINAADRHGLAIDGEGKVIPANRVFAMGSNVPLRRHQLVVEAGEHARLSDYPERITGTLCACGEGQGEFELLPKEEGQKVYMRCRKCGEHSHL
jgi:hypothetical protein